MNFTNYTAKRSRFFSSLESIGELNIYGQDINDNVTLKLKDIRSLILYCSSVLTQEPLLTENIDVLTPGTTIANESLNYDAFLRTTKLNDSLSFYFQATTFANKDPLTFNDIGLLGESNTYKPFDSQDLKAVDSMLTGSIEDIRVFSENHFRFKQYRGTAAFHRATVHKKGYTIFLTDKSLYMTIIATKYDFRSGLNSYIAIMYVGE